MTFLLHNTPPFIRLYLLLVAQSIRGTLYIRMDAMTISAILLTSGGRFAGEKGPN
jgi:hypothetical protein